MSGVDADALTQTLGRLVDTPSETGNEGRICTQIATRLMPATTVDRVGNSLVAGSRTDRPLVLLVGHLDTVPDQGQGPARVEDGRLHGLGSADMKAGLAVMIHLLERPQDGPFDVVGVFYEGEEGPASGNSLETVLRHVPWLQAAAFGIVLEPSDGEIQLGCNGAINATVTFLGKSAHSARPWWGENAITKAGRWLAERHQAEPEDFDIGGLVYREVMSVTRAAGGIANNIIPPRFTLNLNYRFNPTRTVEQATTRLMELCAEADEVEVVDAAPAGPVDVDHPLVGVLRETSGASLAPKQGWTDVARLGVFGIPAVNFGPGETAKAHQADESVALADLVDTYRALEGLLGG